MDTSGKPVQTDPRLDRCPIGTNLDSFSDYSLEWPLLDGFKRSRRWISGSDSAWDDGRPLAVDEDGWVRTLLPGQTARALLFWADDSKRPSGDYVVTYDGEGALDFWNTATVVSSSPGRYVVHVGDGKLGISVVLTRTDPTAPLRNIHVLLPGGLCTNDASRSCHLDAECDGAPCVPFEAAAKTYMFHPDFVKGLRPYGVVRFMNWMFANDSLDRTWQERPKPTDVRWTGDGVPVEVMVELTNQLGADPWFTLPHRADDDYVRHFAEYVRDHSKSGRVYVEYSNEVWNSQFQQAAYAASEGKRLALSGDPFEAQLRFYSRRSVQVFRIFESVFGGTERLVRVMASQAVNRGASETVLGFENAFEHTDALAVAPYIGVELGDPDATARVSRMSLDGLMEELQGPAVDRAARFMEEQAMVARKFGVKLVAYEGGQHLVARGPMENDGALNALFDAANRNPRMKNVYLRYLNAWRDRGGELFVHFSSFSGYSRWGRWGATERVGQGRTEAPKLDALMAYSELRPLAQSR